MSDKNKTVAPKRPVVAVCVDGSQPEYIEEAIKAGVMLGRKDYGNPRK